MAYLLEDWALLISYIIAGLIGTIGNGFIIRTIFKRRMKTTTFFLIANQAFSDLSCGIFYISLWFFCSSKMLSFGTPGLIICELTLTLKTSTFVVSSLTMTAIAIERYLKLYHPLGKSLSPSKTIFGIWALGISIAVICMFQFRSSEFFTENRLIGCRIAYNVNTTFFNQHWNYLLAIGCSCFIPVLITAFMYYKVIVKISDRHTIGKVNNEQAEAFEESKRQTTKMLMLIVVIYFTACGPLFTLWLIHYYFASILVEPCTNNAEEPLYYRLAYLTCVSSICLNPFIYCYYNQIFRSEAAKIACQIRNIFIPGKKTESISNTKEHVTSSTTTSYQNVVK